MSQAPPLTPDGRYIVVRGRLWRSTNPNLDAGLRALHVKELMEARRQLRKSQTNTAARKRSRAAVQAAKVALGERGPVWWTDGAMDYNRHLVKNSPYKGWFDSLPAQAEP